MYSEWASLSPVIAANSNNSSNTVLNKFSSVAGKEVSQAVVKQLAANLGITQPAEPSILITDEEVNWCMSVICHGLSLPLSEHETIKDCVNVYCEWLTALYQVPRISVPKPICEDPNLYARKIINHFHKLFVPRQGEVWPFLYQDNLGADLINRQAVLCHRVLRTLQQVSQSSQKLTPETWESLLLFLLAINEVLLAPPGMKDDVSDQLCERVLSVLFEVWLIACVRNFPSPSLWKTLQESCLLLRHRIALIEQWNRVNLALTARLLEFLYGPSFPELKILEEDAQLIPSGMTNDCVAQTWYRFLRTIGSPIALCSPQVVSKTPQFMQWVVSRADGVEAFHHPCLLQLPFIFLKAIKGIASQVDAFLGIYQAHQPIEVSGDPTTNSTTSAQQQQKSEELSRLSGSEIKNSGFISSSSLAIASIGGGGSSATPSVGTNVSGSGNDSPTPTQHRRLAKSFSVAPSLSQTTKALPSLGFIESRPPLASARPKCNSILHLFGEWLFEAAHIGGDAWIQNTKKLASEASRRPSSMIVDSRKGSLSLSQPSSLSESADLPTGLKIDKFESGRAEAIGALCRIFCAKKTGEEILPVYLARFYVAIQQGLKTPESRECEETLASILYNSSDLFRLDLDGIHVLLPSFISALELVLPEKELKMKSNIVINKSELRRASIQILLTILALPLHFQTLPIRDLTNAPDKVITFIQLKPRLINILMNAIQVETDPQNTHMLLGGLMLCVQDSALFEECAEINVDARQTSPAPSDTNLLSSAYSDKSACSIASGGSSSIGGNSTATLGNDYPSLSASDDIPDDIEFFTNYDNAHALFVRATYLVCHRLISSWKTDLNVSLAALELLSGLARMNIKDSDPLECKRAVKWICDYICYQCSRPPPAHSKDLHSTIVAAFQCTSAWLIQHPYLLQDKECLTTVLEVVELGISGSKSVGKPGEPIKLKEDKELKPVSMRVREAAETMLTLVLEQVGFFPNECGPQSISSLLDEITLYKHCISHPNEKSETSISAEQAVQKFRYFVTENSTILALLEEPLGNDQDPQPTITLLLRGPFGRNAWTLQLRHLPRSKSGTKYHAPNPGRPVPMNDVVMRQEIEQKFYPDGVERIVSCVADYSIPTIDSVIQKIGSKASTQLVQLLENQTVAEKLAWAETDNSDDGLNGESEIDAPPVVNEFQAARLFLSHFGFLSIDEDKSTDENDSMVDFPVLTALDTKQPGFLTDLQALDKLSPRTNDTLHIFYVKVGQSSATEIIENVSETNVASLDKHFWNVLLNLGWPVEIEEHAGWTGFVNTSWKIQTSTVVTSKKDFNVNTPENMKFNGEKRILYWADVSGEIAFVLPTKWNKTDDAADGSCLSLASSSSNDSEKTHPNLGDRSFSVQQGNTAKVSIGQKPRTLSLELDRPKSHGSPGNDPVAPARRRTCAIKPALSSQSGVKIFMVWLESFEDYLNFPTDELLNYARTGEEYQSGQIPRASDCHIIFLQSLNSGLLRVKLQGPSGRMNFASPLVDGMVVNKRTVGTLIRQTVYNMAKRRRLDNDLYQPPHVRRRLKALDIVHKYKLDMSEPELLAHLFKSSSST
ncbi:ral GTPase-activating protein subunit beta isoform X3 [Contarinia nasturtii]|uniref:ral GTPase-activating protein subunit beta isoform X3 n=1 Tax=Contarinia nasturtii TaxID=265458 RepID=UPI0012D3F401|nr:ral GTPase-activating protein subunit beta isoform X3 [Contarinia nasturtii]